MSEKQVYYRILHTCTLQYIFGDLGMQREKNEVNQEMSKIILPNLIQTYVADLEEMST